ncbi:MAG: hypothetical protein QW303_02960 [Nitrososphaerota archaeon]
MDLENALKKYLEECKIPMTVNELITYTQYLPIYLDDKEAGILGLDIIPSEILGQVAVIKLIYIYPEYRGNFKAVAVCILEALENKGIKFVELHTNKKISKWLRYYAKSYPDIFIHFGEVTKLKETILTQNK